MVRHDFFLPYWIDDLVRSRPSDGGVKSSPPEADKARNPAPSGTDEHFTKSSCIILLEDKLSKIRGDGNEKGGKPIPMIRATKGSQMIGAIR